VRALDTTIAAIAEGLAIGTKTAALVTALVVSIFRLLRVIFIRNVLRVMAKALLMALVALAVGPGQLRPLALNVVEVHIRRHSDRLMVLVELKSVA
jgi:hypothetical protein